MKNRPESVQGKDHRRSATVGDLSAKLPNQCLNFMPINVVFDWVREDRAQCLLLAWHNAITLQYHRQRAKPT